MNPAEKIADVLKAHRWVSFDMSHDACGGCDWRGLNRTEHQDHVAAQIVAALELAEEWAAGYESHFIRDEYRIFGGTLTDEKNTAQHTTDEYIERGSTDIFTVVRHVTAWTPTEEMP